MTLNEFLFGVISQTMKRCMEYHGDEITREIGAQVPISLRRAPQHPMDFEFHNDISFAIFPLRLVDDFKSERDKVKADLDHIKKSPALVMGMYY